jgi:hypothetical protein
MQTITFTPTPTDLRRGEQTLAVGLHRSDLTLAQHLPPRHRAMQLDRCLRHLPSVLESTRADPEDSETIKPSPTQARTRSRIQARTPEQHPSVLE